MSATAAPTCSNCSAAPGVHDLVDDDGSVPRCDLCLIASLPVSQPGVRVAVLISRNQPDMIEESSR